MRMDTAAPRIPAKLRHCDEAPHQIGGRRSGYTGVVAMHAHEPPHHHAPDTDWAAMAADIALEDEVLMPYWTETASWVAALCRHEGLEVRRIVDVGCGPGVGTCVLAQQFEPAVVLAVDASNEMLDRTAARAKTLGLSGRVETQRAELPAGLDRLGGADLIWVAMVLHHIGDQVATLRELRSLLEPGGVLAITEFGDPPNILPADVDVDRPGLRARLWDVNLAGSASPIDLPMMIEEAGFKHIAERLLAVQLDPPLPV
ncbi:MAG: methyltransferase domain-containing protein [Chloroflexota bacterium]